MSELDYAMVVFVIVIFVILAIVVAIVPLVVAAILMERQINVDPIRPPDFDLLIIFPLKHRLKL